ncbi:hypothetical protein LTR53_003717 [Teratosphaeriaceae sp. CCFEE 6253]|nr:hypothetical protein LTR53_003717 [Teratosphaeriaceae sp. CCFEE 6253]
MPVSESVGGVEWLVLPGNLRGYMSAGRKGRLYGDIDRQPEWEDRGEVAVGDKAGYDFRYDYDDDSDCELVYNYGNGFDLEDDFDGYFESFEINDGNDDEEETLDPSEIRDIKAIQEQGLTDMTACVASGEASWETVVLTCGCVAQEQEDREASLKARMARNRRGDVFVTNPGIFDENGLGNERYHGDA